MKECNYKKKIIIAGNHDNRVQNQPGLLYSMLGQYEYLCDSGTEFEGLKVWGSPWTKAFKGMNPHCKAFTVDTEEELAEKWALIPSDIDILVTHSPPQGIFDGNIHGENCGSPSLFKKSTSLKKLKLMVWGHIHEDYGMITSGELLGYSQLDHALPPSHSIFEAPIACYVNASHVNERYEPINKPVRIVL